MSRKSLGSHKQSASRVLVNVVVFLPQGKSGSPFACEQVTKGEDPSDLLENVGATSLKP